MKVYVVKDRWNELKVYSESNYPKAEAEFDRLVGQLDCNPSKTTETQIEYNRVVRWTEGCCSTARNFEILLQGYEVG